MGEHLAVMAAHVRSLAARRGAEAAAGATLMQARVHLGDGPWRRWVERDVQIDLDRARELLDCAERAGASVETLRPKEFGSA